MNLPNFRYHPDPLATGSIERSDDPCVCCGQTRGFVYVGPVYAVEEYVDCICPWCIADGSAHAKLAASFTDESGVGGYGKWDEVPEAVRDEVAHRTPGFAGWQQEQWWTHCGDAGEFLGRVGSQELAGFGPEAVAAIRAAEDVPEGREGERFMASLKRDGSPTAYLFRWTKCGEFGGYWDCD
jgi:uncharacterized protein